MMTMRPRLRSTSSTTTCCTETAPNRKLSIDRIATYSLSFTPSGGSDKIVSVKFIKKYIHIAKSMKPALTDDANEMIAEAYADLRQFEQQQEDMARTQPITVRALETMIRLATAHAKGRMSRTVDVIDAEAAIELVQFAYFKRIMEKPKKRRTRFEEEGEGEEEEGDEMDVDEDEVIPKSKQRKAVADAAGDGPDLETEKSGKSSQKRTTTITTVREMDAEQFKKFKSLLNTLFQKTLAQQLNVSEIYSKIKEEDAEMDRAAIDWALDRMQTDNQVFVADGIVYLI